MLRGDFAVPCWATTAEWTQAGGARRAARQSPGTVCRPHTPSSSPPQRPRPARPTGSRTPKFRDSWRQDAGTGLGRRSAAGRAPPPASRGGVAAGGEHYAVRWSGHDGTRRAEDDVQGRAAPRRRPARPRLASGGPARHLHRRRLLFASQQTIIHAQDSAGLQAVSGQRNSSACMFDGWIPIVDARYRYILGPTEVNVASPPVLCVYVCVC